MSCILQQISQDQCAQANRTKKTKFPINLFKKPIPKQNTIQIPSRQYISYVPKQWFVRRHTNSGKHSITTPQPLPCLFRTSLIRQVRVSPAERVSPDFKPKKDPEYVLKYTLPHCPGQHPIFHRGAPRCH